MSVYDDLFDQYDDPTVECKFCDAGGLSWVFHNGGWRLFDGATLHDCRVVTADDFEVL